jgi:hypothetical protein
MPKAVSTPLRVKASMIAWAQLSAMKPLRFRFVAGETAARRGR